MPQNNRNNLNELCNRKIKHIASKKFGLAEESLAIRKLLKVFETLNCTSSELAKII